MMNDYYTHLRKGVNWMRHNRDKISTSGHATDMFTDWTIDYPQERQSDNRPYFLYPAYNAPH